MSFLHLLHPITSITLSLRLATVFRSQTLLRDLRDLSISTTASLHLIRKVICLLLDMGHFLNTLLST